MVRWVTHVVHVAYLLALRTNPGATSGLTGGSIPELLMRQHVVDGDVADDRPVQNDGDVLT